jgi:hypothetical protein
VNFQKSFEQRPHNWVNYPNRSICRRAGRVQGSWFAPVAGAINPGGEGQNRLKFFFDTAARFQ